ncbi:unnamed protein product [Lactuca virosa]|uniref:Uncharacterized protein n=1 Tax=Lactuca virosa TaxID=75947 RepID=A0AAU9LJD8_9ASTR|nr:unnamed protein product [Lactuca virosa]
MDVQNMTITNYLQLLGPLRLTYHLNDDITFGGDTSANNQEQNGNITSKDEIDETLASEKVEKVKVKSAVCDDEGTGKSVDIDEN